MVFLIVFNAVLLLSALLAFIFASKIVTWYIFAKIVCLRVIHAFSFGHMHWNKAIMSTFDVMGDRFLCYAEQSQVTSPLPILLEHFDALRGVIEKAYYDFPRYCASRGLTVLEEKKTIKACAMIFVAEPTYQSYDLMSFWKTDATLACYAADNCTVYIKCKNGRYDILENRKTIRHELFHHLSHVYCLPKWAKEEWEAHFFEECENVFS